MYFCDIENFAYGEINERSFSNPHPIIGSYIGFSPGKPLSEPMLPFC